MKTSSVSNMRKHIEEKKIEQRKDQKNLLYGTITSYDEKDDSIAHCRILDPPSENNYENPRKLRILSRLNFYFREISSISKAHFLFALADRLQILEKLDIEEIERLNNLALIKLNGEPFEYPISYQYHKTIVLEYDSFADVMKIGKNQYLLYGFRDQIVDILIKQNYQNILQLKFNSSSKNTTVVAKLPKRAIEKGTSFQETDYGYFEQKLFGKVYATSAGRIYGILKNPTIKDE